MLLFLGSQILGVKPSHDFCLRCDVNMEKVFDLVNAAGTIIKAKWSN